MEISEKHLTFREAMIEVNNGFIIESVVTGNRYLFSPHGELVDTSYTKTPTEPEIRNKWKIPIQKVERQVFLAGSVIYMDKESADSFAKSIGKQVKTEMQFFNSLLRFEPW